MPKNRYVKILDNERAEEMRELFDIVELYQKEYIDATEERREALDQLIETARERLRNL